MKYKIFWGASGRVGQDFADAKEMALGWVGMPGGGYASSLWGEIEADSPEEAIEKAKKEIDIIDWYPKGEEIYVLLKELT